MAELAVSFHFPYFHPGSSYDFDNMNVPRQPCQVLVDTNRSLWGRSIVWGECCSQSSSLFQTQPAAVTGQWALWTETVRSGWPPMLSQQCAQSSHPTSWMYLETQIRRWHWCLFTTPFKRKPFYKDIVRQNNRKNPKYIYFIYYLYIFFFTKKPQCKYKSETLDQLDLRSAACN